MTAQNDFNTLINAIIDNLEEKGVTNVSFESETGIMGLVDRILEIETESNIKIPTVIQCSLPIPGSNDTVTIGDSYICSGTLTGSHNDFLLRIGGATIYVYNQDDLLGQAVTNPDGTFTINGMYHKATDQINYSVKFLATDIFLSSTVTGGVNKPVNKKSIDLPQSINDIWVLTPGDYSINIGALYEGAPVTLMIDSQAYDMEYVDEYGFVSFDVSNLTGVNECQLVVETNDVFSNAQSNTFNISIGVNIYINPELRVTSDKNILSYEDKESAIITAQLVDNASTPQELTIKDAEIIFEHKTSTTYSDFLSIPKQYDSFELLFKTSGAYFQIDNDLFYYRIDIPSNSSSQFKLVWDKPNLYLYEDDDEILVDYIGMTNNNGTSPSLGDYVHFIVDDTNKELFSDIKLNKVSSNSIHTDVNGQTKYTYESQNIGDIIISANMSGGLSNSVQILDIYQYNKDDLQSFSCENGVYHITGYSQFIQLIENQDNVQIEALINPHAPNTGLFIGLFIGDALDYFHNMYRITAGTGGSRLDSFDTTQHINGNWSRVGSHLSYDIDANAFYRFIMRREGSIITVIVETEYGTNILNRTYQKSYNTTKMGLCYNEEMYFKNLIIKPLYSSEIYIDDCTTDKSNNYSKTSDTTITYGNNEYEVTATTGDQVINIFKTRHKNVSFEAKIKGETYGLMFSDSNLAFNNNSVLFYRRASASFTAMTFVDGEETTHTTENPTIDTDKYYIYKIIKNNNKYTCSVSDLNGTELKSYEVTHAGAINQLNLFIDRAKTIYIKDIKVMKIDYIYKPLLNGSETIKQISGTTTVTDGVMSDGCGYLNAGFDNSGDWVLECDVLFTGRGGTGFMVVNSGTNARDRNHLQISSSGTINTVSNGSYEINSLNLFTVTANTWYHVKIVKNNDNAIVTVDNNTQTITWSNLTNASRLCVGVDKWGNNYTQVKNIIVKPL